MPRTRSLAVLAVLGGVLGLPAAAVAQAPTPTPTPAPPAPPAATANPDGTFPPLEVPPIITYKKAAVNAFVAAAARKLAIPARDASVTITLTRIVRHHSKTGRALDAKSVTAAIEKTVVDAT